MLVCSPLHLGNRCVLFSGQDPSQPVYGIVRRSVFVLPPFACGPGGAEPRVDKSTLDPGPASDEWRVLNSALDGVSHTLEEALVR